MSNKKFSWKASMLLVMLLVWLCGMSVFAASNDNSLSSLGITTEGAVVSPEFQYSTWEYDVTVPSGTQTLELDPVPSNGNAWIVDILGTELVDGQTTVQIIVSAESGDQFTYTLHVKAEESAGTAAPAESEAEVQTESETETEPETEDPRYVKVDRDSLQAAEDTIAALKAEAGDYRDRLGLMMKILYGLIAFCVILLFVVINLILKKKDLKKELENYMGYGQPGEFYQQSQDGYEQQAYDDDGYEQKPYEEHGYEQQAYDDDGYERKPYEKNGNEQQAYDDGYKQKPYEKNGNERQSCEEPVSSQKPQELKWEPQRSAGPADDDPATVPKPEKARRKAKKMPEYDPPQKEARYQPRKNKGSENVEVNMIDL